MLEIRTINVFNPFTNEKELCICKLYVTTSNKNKFIGGELMAVVTEGGCELMDFINQDLIDEIEDDAIVEYAK